MRGAPGPEEQHGHESGHEVGPDAGHEAGHEVGHEVPVDGPETLAEKRLMATLGRRAREVNLARVVRLLELLDAADAGALDEDGRQEAENLAHQVVGSAGTFGFPTASTDASVVEDHFAHASGGRPDVGGSPAAVRGTLERLRALFAG